MSVVYKIYCLDENITDCYIGSTNDLKQRKRSHKTVCNNTSDKSYNLKVYTFIRNNGGIGNWEFEVLEQFETKMSKTDLEKIEGQYIKNNNATLNSIIAGRSKQYYYLDNKEDIAERIKKYYENNKEKILEIKKKLYENNKEQIQERKKKYYENNKEKILEKILCEYCKTLTVKQTLKRHQQSKKCKSFQNK